jgi:hypothetical protein
MSVSIAVVVLIAWSSVVSPAQSVGDRELARLLVNDETRGGTVRTIVNSEKDIVPVLLSSAKSPHEVLERGLTDYMWN